MEVLQVTPVTLHEKDASHAVVFGSWCDEIQGGEGMECCQHLAFSASLPLSDHSLKEHLVTNQWLEDLNNFDLTDDLTSIRQQRRRLFEAIQRLFPKRKKGLKRGKGSKNTKKRTRSSDDSSVASTECSSVCIDNHDDISVQTLPTSNKKDEKLRRAEPTLMDLLRVLVEYNSEKYATASNKDIEISLVSDAPLIQTRLYNTGVVDSNEDFEFTLDKISKEVKHLYENAPEEHNVNVTHVKTGIWEVVCLNDDGSPQDPFYIVTGVSMDDRVDTKKLRKAVFAGQTHKRRPKLGMAPTPIAEELAGFKSGTIAPILHSTNMKLFLEETIAASPGDHKLAVGSGMFGKCLSISAGKFLQIANANPKGMESCALVQGKRGKQNIKAATTKAEQPKKAGQEKHQRKQQSNKKGRKKAKGNRKGRC